MYGGFDHIVCLLVGFTVVVDVVVVVLVVVVGFILIINISIRVLIVPSGILVGIIITNRGKKRGKNEPIPVDPTPVKYIVIHKVNHIYRYDVVVIC